MRSARFHALATAALIAAALGGCGSGGADNAKNRPTATPTRTAQASKVPKGIDVLALNRARAELVVTCRKRENGDDSAASLRSLRSVGRTVLAAFKASPDEPFKRSPTAPPVTARGILRAAGFVARHQCGGGPAARIGDRLSRIAARMCGNAG
jgi:hypothetical protein